MADRRVIVDTGPLVAFMVRQDEHHAWAAEQFASLSSPLLTCEPVLTETYFLVRRLRDGGRRFFELLRSGLLSVEFAVLAEREALASMIRKYADLPMSLADACLVRMSELHADAIVLTTDDHFEIYRRFGRQRIPMLAPEGRK